MNYTMLNALLKLENSGIANAASRAGWKPYTHEQQIGWAYPVNPASTARRWKNYDSATKGKKYLWLPAKPAGCNYYLPYGEAELTAAIAAANGTLYIANGEKGVLTYHAAGLYNVTCWFGETSVPTSLPADLARWNVQRLVYHPDLDDAGRASARKLITTLQDSAITIDVRQLPTSLPPKGDTNDLWIALNFDPAAFIAALDAAPALDLPAEPPSTLHERFIGGSFTNDSTWDDVRQQVTHAMERTFDIRRYKSNGWSNPFRNHWRDEQRPSAGYNHLTGVMHDFGGDTYTLTALAALFNIPLPAFAPRHFSRTCPTLNSPSSAAAPSLNNPWCLGDLAVDRLNPPTLHAYADVHLRHISDIDYRQHLVGCRAVLIKSPIGSGKTTLIKRIIAEEAARLRREPAVLVITYRTALVRQIAATLGILSYKDLDGDDRILLKSAPQLAISYDSLWRVEGNTYDLVFIDELSQFHPHLAGGTMQEGQPRRAYHTLKTLIEKCGMFVGLDAHLSDIDLAWAKALKGDYAVQAITNTYRADKGSLTLHSSVLSLYTRVCALIRENAGCVAIPTSSKAESDTLYRLLCDQFGPDSGFLINSDNSESTDAQDFIAHINQRIANLRFLVYSPSLGTGIDITTPVRAVCGVFGSQPLAPADMLQMMGRCRTALERHAFVQPVRGNRPTDWRDLLHTDTTNAAHTAELAHFAAYHIDTADPVLSDAAKLLAQYRAQRNAAMNDPLSYFVAYAHDDGYTLHYEDSAGDPVLKTTLQSIRKTLKSERKQAVLNAEPVTHQQLDHHRRRGELTPTVRAGHERFKIEDTVGLTINPQIYDDLHTPNLRQRVRRFTDLFDALDHLQASDRQEAIDGWLLSKRSHRTATRLLFERIIRHLFNCDVLQLPAVLHKIPARDIHTRMNGFLDLYGDPIKRLLGWRPDHHTDNPTALLRWLLKQIGLKLVSTQVGNGKKRYRVYSLDTQQFDKMVQYAEARLAHLAQRRAYPQNGQEVISNKPLLSAEPPPNDDQAAKNSPNSAAKPPPSEN